MPDRITHEHPTIDTIRGRVARHGGSRRRIDLPEGADASVGGHGSIRCVVEERDHFAQIDYHGDHLAIIGLYTSLDQAEAGSPAGSKLTDWLTSIGCNSGSSIAIDIIDAGERIGLRRYGSRGVYTVESQPSDTLRDLADRYSG